MPNKKTEVTHVGTAPEDTVESQIRRENETVLSITQFQQKVSAFLGANSSEDNQPKTFEKWLSDFQKWANS